MSDFDDTCTDAISEFWRLCCDLSVRQAALLIVGVEPASDSGVNCEKNLAQARPRGYEAVKHAIMVALRADTIRGKHVPLYDHDINGNQCAPFEGTTDVEKSTVERDSLVEWLSKHGVRSGFFFPAATDAPDYLDPKNSRYAPKLAAAVRAWQSVGDPAGKSPKQALAKWLREHAAEFGLTDDESDLMPYHAILGSEARRKSYGPFRKYDDREPLEKWLKSSESGVQNEEFSRAELARWVRENNVPSIYRFDLEASAPATPSASGATVPQAETPAQGTADDTPAATAVPNSRERNTLLRIIGGLAMATYKMNIHGRMDGITEILNDLAQHGVTVSEETLRGKLREAARLIDPPADNKG